MEIALKILMVLGFVYCYQEGGQGFKLMKKLIGPAILSGLILALLAISKELGVFTVIGALLYFASANGFSYGDTFTQGKTWKKILFRGLCGASYGLSGLLLGIGTGHWLLGAFQLVLTTLGSIYFGVMNPFSSSKMGDWSTRIEDMCISSCYILLIPFIV